MIDRNPWRQNVCAVCGAAISGVEARLYDNTCPRYRCRAAYWQKTARRLQGEKQQRTREAARRRKEHALAHRDRLAAELRITTPHALLPIALPAQQRPLVRLTENRKALFREHLERVVQEAFQATVSLEAPTLPNTNDETSGQDEMPQILLAACAVCQGRCCCQGGDRAYLNVDVVLRYRAQHPQATVEDVYREYDARLAERTYEESCIYHQEQGCGLPRDLRSDTCNGFECEELAELRRTACASGEALFLVALANDRAVRWSVRGWSECPAEPLSAVSTAGAMARS